MEELWTDRHRTAVDRETFLSAVEALARGGHVWVLATLRSDFYPQAQQSDAFLRLKGTTGQYDLRPPTPAALAQIIAEPARLAGLTFERDDETGRSLEEEIIEDALHEPEALPLLQYALRELYEACAASPVFSFAEYHALGRVEGALGRRAEAVFTALGNDAQAAFGDVLHALVTVDPSGEGAALRRRAPLAALTDSAAKRTLVDAMLNNRFLTADRVGDLPIATVAHEALLRCWDRLAAWVSANREHLRLRARVEHAQTHWEQEHRDPSLLLPVGLPLAEGRTLLANAPALLSDERGQETAQFIRASIAHVESARSQRTRVRRAVVGMLAAALALIASLAVTTIVVRSERDKTQEKTAMLFLEKGASLSAAGDAGRGVLWMSRSLELCPASAPDLQQSIRGALQSTSSTIHTLREIYQSPGPTIITAYSPDGKSLLLGGKSAYLIDLATGQRRSAVQETPGDEISGGAFTADGKFFAISTQKGVIRIASVSSGEVVEPVIMHPGTIKSIAFSPDGRDLLVGAQSSNRQPRHTALQVYDWAQRKPGLVFPCKSDLYCVAYSPDGQTIATASREERSAQLWNATTGKPVGSPMLHAGVVFCVAFSPDGKSIVTGCLDGGVRIWSVEQEDSTQRAPSGRTLWHTGPVRSAVFSRDGRSLLSSSEDGTARMWDVRTGRQIGQILSHPSELRHALFSPDQTHVVTAGFEGAVRLWRVGGEQSLAKILPNPGIVAEVAFSPDGTTALSGCQDSVLKRGESRLWNSATGEMIGKPLPQNGQVMTVAFSPEGDLVLTGGNDGTARLWNTKTGLLAQDHWKCGYIVAASAFSPDGRMVAVGGRGARLELRERSSGKIINTCQAYDPSGMWVWCVAFSPDGRSLLTAGETSGRLWSIPELKPIGKPMLHGSEARLAILSPDGRYVLTGSHDKTARLWSATDGTPLCLPLEHKGTVLTAAFGPDSAVVATGAADYTLRLWEVPSGRPLVPPALLGGWVRSVAFSSDGKMLATGCDDGTARIWKGDSGTPLGAVLEHQGPVRKVAFSPDGKTVLTGSSDSTARLWTLPMPAPEDPARLARRVEVLTGMELDADGTTQVLTLEQWKKRRQQLEAVARE